MTKRALNGVKILEYTSFVTGPYCAKLLADLGADVIKIERPGSGDISRARGPFPGDVPDPEKSALFLYLNTNKMGITLDLKPATGSKIFKELVEWADILIEDKAPDVMERLGLQYDVLKEINPGLIMVSITPFGQTGPYSNYRAHQLNVYHGSGLGYITPIEVDDPSREPLKGGGYAGDYFSGLFASLAALGALYVKGETGLGQHVDCSNQAALTSLQRIQAASYANEKTIQRRTTQAQGTSGMGGLMQCLDGYVTATLAEDHQWMAFCELLGHPEWWENEKLRQRHTRGEAVAELQPQISEWMMKHSKEEVFHKAQALGCPVVPFRSPDEVFNDVQYRERGFFKEVNHPKAGMITYASVPYQFSRTPWSIRYPAPLLGQHNHDIYCRLLGYSNEDLVKFRQAGII